MEAGFLLYVLSSACISWYIFSTLFTIFRPIKSTLYSVFYYEEVVDFDFSYYKNTLLWNGRRCKCCKIKHLWNGNCIQTNFGAFSMKLRIKIHSWNSSSNLHKCIQLGRIWNLYLWELICIVIIPLLNYFSTPSPTWPTSKSDATFILWFCLYVAPKQYLGCFLAEDEINSGRFHRNSEWFSDPGQNTGFIVHPWTSFQRKSW